MILYPAIDLRAGHCVRLAQGKFDQQTTYDTDPLRVAQAYADAGATHLHVVDLDGAKARRVMQTDLILQIVRQSRLRVQVGGGVRTSNDVQQLLDGGVARVVIGSLAVQDPATTSTLFERFGGDRITLGIDVHLNASGEAHAATDGWQVGSGMRVTELISNYLRDGLQHVLCTDIGRDGMLTGPSIKLYRSLRAYAPQLALQASGGIATLEDLRTLAAMGMHGAMIGKALYEKRFTLGEALQLSLSS